MAEDRNQNPAGGQETMQGNLREKPAHASSFADNQYAGDKEPGPDAMPSGDAGGANVSQQGGGTDSSKQGGNTGNTPNASG
jgi:hypothetical protein